MSQRLIAACHALFSAVVQQAQAEGRIFAAFDQQGDDEAALRQKFAELRARRRNAGSGTGAADEVAALLRRLNAHLGARYRGADIALASRCFVETIDTLGWWNGASPRLLGGAADQADQVALAVSDALNGIQAGGARRPYGLITALFHYYLPESAVVADRAASQSIWMWAVFAFDDVEQAADRARFDPARTYGDRAATGYRDILEFYRLLWRHAPPELRAQAKDTAARWQQHLRAKFQQPAARVTALDLIHGLLRHAGGDPIRLGLAAPLPGKT